MDIASSALRVAVIAAAIVVAVAGARWWRLRDAARSEIASLLDRGEVEEAAATALHLDRPKLAVSVQLKARGPAAAARVAGMVGEHRRAGMLYEAAGRRFRDHAAEAYERAGEGSRASKLRVLRDGGGRLSLERPRPLPASAPRGRDARDLYYYDAWVPHPGINPTPSSIRSSFTEAERGYPQLQVDTFDDLTEGDGTARNLFEHRERVVANKPVVFTAGDNTDDGKLAALTMAIVWARLNGREMLEHLLRFNRYGYMGVEMEWDVAIIGGRPWVVPVAFLLPPARRFRIGMMGMIPVPGEVGPVRIDELRLYNRLEYPQGEPLAPGKWIVLKNAATQIARAGLMRTAAVYMMAKRMAFRDWIVLSEKYGIPMPLAKYDQSSEQAGLDTAKEIVQRIGNDGGAAIPKDIDLELSPGPKIEHPIQATLISFCNAEISKLVNGSTLQNDTKDSSGASYALGNIHHQVAWAELERDGKFVSDALTLQVCKPFCQFNGLSCEAPTAKIVVEPDLGPIEATGLMVKGKNELGIEVSQTQWREFSGMRAPSDPRDAAPGMQVEKFPLPAGGNP